MSIHRSLKTQGKLVRERNVFSRAERLEVLKKEGRWKDGQSVFHLPKVRTRFKVRTKKKEKVAEAEGAPGAAPAAGAEAKGAGGKGAPAGGAAKGAPAKGAAPAAGGKAPAAEAKKGEKKK